MRIVNNKEYYQIEDIWYTKDKNGQQRKVSSEKLLQELNEPEQILEPLPSKGLGDSIAKVTSFLGIEPCEPCKQRKDTLNRLFPYLKADTMEKLNDEDQMLMERILKIDPVPNNEAIALFALYNKIYKPSPPIKRCLCPGLFKTIIERLKLVMRYPEGK